MNITNQNLTELGKLLDPTGIIKSTKEELLVAFKKIVEMVQKMKEENVKELDRIISAFGSLKSKLDSDTSITLAKTERIVAAELESLLRRFSAEQKKIDDKLATIENGRDADETKIVSDVISQLPALQKIVDETIRQIPKQEEKIFGIDDIEGLKKTFEELEERIGKSRRFGGGGFSAIAMNNHFIDDETPSGAVNGSNKAFVLGHTPIPESSLKVYKAGARQRLTEDYTFSGRTITFNTAPVVGEIIFCDYRS